MVSVRCVPTPASGLIGGPKTPPSTALRRVLRVHLTDRLSLPVSAASTLTVSLLLSVLSGKNRSKFGPRFGFSSLVGAAVSALSVLARGLILFAGMILLGKGWRLPLASVVSGS